MSLLAWHRPSRDVDLWAELELLEPSALDVAPFAQDAPDPDEDHGAEGARNVVDDPFGTDVWWERD